MIALAMADGSQNHCGTCDACCVHLDIADPAFGPAGFTKAKDVRCQHLAGPGGGCGIYHQPRPAPCTGFKCIWRQGVEDAGTFVSAAQALAVRPDNLGVMFTLVDNWLGHDDGDDGLNVVVATEIRPGAMGTALAGKVAASIGLAGRCGIIISALDKTGRRGKGIIIPEADWTEAYVARVNARQPGLLKNAKRASEVLS